MTDEGLVAGGVEALEGLIGLVLEEALDEAVRRPPDGAGERLQRLAGLRRAGAEVVLLAEAAAAVLGRWPGAERGPE